MEIITSAQNKKIKERAKLLKKKERDRSNLFLVEGKHLLEEAEKAQILEEIYLLEGQKNPTSIEARYCSQNVINKLSNQSSDAKMIGICRKKNKICKNTQVALFLDEIQDPGNIGTIFRTAYSFGIDCIYLSSGCADPYNPKAIQASKGALFHLPFKIGKLSNFIEKKQKEGMAIYATALHRESIPLQTCKPSNSYGIVLGNEGQGIHDEILSLCDKTIYIEMDQFESLNVAIACSIVIYTLKHRKSCIE